MSDEIIVEGNFSISISHTEKQALHRSNGHSIDLKDRGFDVVPTSSPLISFGIAFSVYFTSMLSCMVAILLYLFCLGLAYIFLSHIFIVVDTGSPLT